MSISVRRTQNKSKKLYTRKPHAEMTVTLNTREIKDESSLEFSGMHAKFNEAPSGLISLHPDQRLQIRASLRFGKSMKVGNASHIPLEYLLTVAV